MQVEKFNTNVFLSRKKVQLMKTGIFGGLRQSYPLRPYLMKSNEAEFSGLHSCVRSFAKLY